MAARRGRSQARRSNSGRFPGWLIALGVGLALGIGLSAVFLLREGFDPSRLLPTPNPAAQAPRESEPAVAQAKEATAPRKPKYDFYTLLAEKEVVIPDTELRASQTTPTPAPAAPGERLLLQVGAFRESADAEAVKAKLALSGQVAQVESVATDSGTWHRVRLGPFESLQALESARQVLTSNGEQVIAIREPGG